MSFRIKASHGFLKPKKNVPSQNQKRSLDDLLENKEGKDSDEWVSSKRKHSGYVRASNAHINQSNGLVIRPNPRAQEDYM